MNKKEKSGQLSRWVLQLQEYDFTIGYRAGINHQKAASLSRIPIASIASVGIELNDWKGAEQNDVYLNLKQLLKYVIYLISNDLELVFISHQLMV